MLDIKKKRNAPSFGWALFVALLVAAPPEAGVAKPAAPKERTIEFTYAVQIPAQPKGIGPIDVFIPLAVSDEQQTVIDRKLEATIPGRELTEETYGNSFWHGRVGLSDGQPIEIKVKYKVKRKAFSPPREGKATPVNQAQLHRFIIANRRVPTSGRLIEKLVADLPIADHPPLKRARAIYDYVIDNMEYKKVGKGWGNGDTSWACSARYGNCTDYHALFISLARRFEMPARFDIGIPIPLDRDEGKVPGYHCWAQQ